jgi:eukaryotic-like serine/threonine-protein kinase
MIEWDPRVNDLFLDALEKVPGEPRQAFLRSACAGNADLSRAVEEMLTAHERAEDDEFISRPAVVCAFPIYADAPGPAAAIEPNPTDVLVGESVQPGWMLEGAPPVGSRLGNFQLLAMVGIGGMGVVYKAIEINSGRIVALKLIRPDFLLHLSGPERQRWIARFRDEARAVAALDHPHIVTLYEVGEFGEIPYFSMKYVEGSDLRRHFFHDSPNGDFRQRQRKAATVLAAIARAVHHAHQRGILHRDLKPANILIDKDGQPLVTDFGLAKRIEEGPTLPSGIVGTPAFMAPEQAAGRKGAAAVAADVYSMGAMLYDLLTGKPPFHGQDALEAIFNVLKFEPHPPRELQPQVDRDLEIICLKCLRKEQGDRYGSAIALADDLENWLAGRPIQARSVGRVERFWRWCRQNPVMASLTGAVLALVVGIAVVSAIYARHLGEALADADLAKQEALHQTWVAYLDKANALRFSGRRGQRFESLMAIQAALRLPVPPGRSRDELRNAAIAALCLPDLGDGPEWDPDLGPAVPEDPAFRRQLEFNRMWSRVPEPKEPPRGQTYSADGRFVLVAVEPYLDDKKMTVAARLWRVDGPAALPILDDPGVHEDASAFSADSKQLAVGHLDGSVTLYETESGREIRKLQSESNPVFCLAYHPSLPRLAVAAKNCVYIFDLDGTALQRLVHPEEIDEIHSLAWRPDGRQLAAGADDKRIYLWDTENGKQATAPWIGHNHGGIHLSFSPAGDRLVSNDWLGHFRLWDAHTGKELFHTPEVHYVYMKTGMLGLRAVGKKLGLLRIAEGHELRQIGGTSVHPDGRLAAFASPDGVGFLNLSSGERVALVPAKGIENALLHGGGMWTTNAGTAYHWPVQQAETVYDIGPPEKVAPLTPNLNSFACDKSGNVLAIPQFSRGTLVIHRDDNNRQVQLEPQYDVRFVFVSPDGKWVATGSSWDDKKGVTVKIWDASTGKLVKDLPIKKARWPFGFSPDNRWLVTTAEWGGVAAAERTENFHRIWAVGTWEEAGTIPTVGIPSWEHDLILDGQRDGTIVITQISTRKELARLSSPEAGRMEPRGILASAFLVATGGESKRTYVWDLPLIRRQLAEIGLDWDGPPFFTEAEVGRARSAYSVRVDSGVLAK